MATDIGKVGIVMKGTWNSSAAYEVLDCVNYAGGTYIAKQSVPANTAPTNTTYWQPAIDAKEVQPDGINHNGIYRGKNLGTLASVADVESFLALYEVSTGKFTDLYVGDYVKIQDGTYNVNWKVAGFGTEKSKGLSNVLGANNITLIPSSVLGNAAMNSTATTGVSKNTSNPLYATTGGNETAGYQAYYGSDMAQIIMPTVEANLATVLGSHLLTRDIFCPNSINASAASMAGVGLTGASNGWNWYPVKASLLTENQVYGSTVCSSSYFDVGDGNEKLPIFNFENFILPSRGSFWLRVVTSSTKFANAGGWGDVNNANANSSLGILPMIVIG